MGACGRLLRPPCIVSFSGGRDSSLVLTVAVNVARREGLPLPVPVTARVSGDAQTEEHETGETPASVDIVRMIEAVDGSLACSGRRVELDAYVAARPGDSHTRTIGAEFDQPSRASSRIPGVPSRHRLYS